MKDPGDVQTSYEDPGDVHVFMRFITLSNAPHIPLPSSSNKKTAASC